MQMPRTQDLAIFVMMTATGDRQTKPIALPLAHAHGVKFTKAVLPPALIDNVYSSPGFIVAQCTTNHAF